MRGIVDVHMYGRTDTGYVRTNNEDCFALDPARGIAVLADGMGGQRAGEIASACAVQTLVAHLQAAVKPVRTVTASAEDDLAATMRGAFVAANRAVRERATDDIACQGMGTTLVAALVQHGRCIVGHLGDSRAYRFRDGRLQRLTADHSVVQELIEAGVLSEADARHAPNRHLVTRAIGIDGDADCDLHVGRMLAGDFLLLCSDGLTDLLDDEAIAAHCTTAMRARRRAKALGRLVDDLVAAALAGGGTDNVTVVGACA
jgi:PPM family protein phosphatase